MRRKLREATYTACKFLILLYYMSSLEKDFLQMASLKSVSSRVELLDVALDNIQSLASQNVVPSYKRPQISD